MKNVNKQDLIKSIRGDVNNVCGEDCIYSHELTDKQIVFARSRIVKKLYDLGFRFKKPSFSILSDFINENLHLACQPERLNEENFFSVGNLISID